MTLSTFRVSVKIKKDTKMWDRMVRNLSRGYSQAVQVGWWIDRYPDGTTVAQVAQWNEEGHHNGGMFAGTYTPPRPFVRLGFIGKLKKSRWVSKFYPHIHQVAIGKMTWRQLHLALADDLRKIMQQTILEWNRPANSAATVALKGFNDPLIDTGKMYDSVRTRLGRRQKRG